jgi:signal transduction histidine kinase
MKRKLLALSRRYLSALQDYLEAGAKGRATKARRVGDEAVSLGLETLDLARIHEIALATLVLPSYSSRMRERMIKQAESFFAEALMAIEKNHGPALQAIVQSQRLKETLGRRTEELAISKRGLKRGVAQRKATQEDFNSRARNSARLLEQSRQLQNHLLHLTRQIFATQENERKRMSRELHDEIAQTLLGINVRLITLKRDSVANMAVLAKDIDGTRRLVEKSVTTMLRVARAIRTASPGHRRVESQAKRMPR